MLIFLIENYTIKTNIIKYYLLPNSTALKLYDQNYDYVVEKQWLLN